MENPNQLNWASRLNKTAYILAVLIAYQSQKHLFKKIDLEKIAKATPAFEKSYDNYIRSLNKIVALHLVGPMLSLSTDKKWPIFENTTFYGGWVYWGYRLVPLGYQSFKNRSEFKKEKP